jgi:hypothetical protein
MSYFFISLLIDKIMQRKKINCAYVKKPFKIRGSKIAANNYLRITSAASKAVPRTNLLRINVKSLVCILRLIFHGLS